MKVFSRLLFLISCHLSILINAQPTLKDVRQSSDPVIAAIIKEAKENSQLRTLGMELMDGIGPRLVGSPKMKQAHDWAVAKYAGWGISARYEKWGDWRGWERGTTHIDMISPWIKTLQGTQLAWSPSTNGQTVTSDVIILADVTDSVAFRKWLPNVKGKFVMISMNQPTGRPDHNWDEFGKKESIEKMKRERDEQTDEWDMRIRRTGNSYSNLPIALEKAGAAGVVTSYWSRAFGANKIFGAKTKKIPTIDLMLEDYGLLYRLTESGKPTKISVMANSKELGMVPTYNTLAEIKGIGKPDEYVMLSAHFDSWDGGTGATDNGTGTLVMMEAMRILKAVYPNPKRTIIVGHWGSEEQGLNGSRSFVEDNPKIVANLQALFNQDNGTGRVKTITGEGYIHAYDYITRWLSNVPMEFKTDLSTVFPGTPSGGGSDQASFIAVGAPAFSLSSLSWGYGNYTWHTNLDTYDKIVFDEVQNNAILTAILVYSACEDLQKTPRDKSVLPSEGQSAEPGKWPAQKKAIRKGGVN